MNQAKCASFHFGVWMVESQWFRSAVDAVRSGILKPKADTIEVDEGEGDGAPGYKVVDGVAVVPIAGPMMKARSKYGGTSTIDTRNQIRKATQDGSVKAILLHIDSPGGTVAGTESLAQDIADAGKPVYAHIEDMGASAAYYAASQSRRITASKTSLVGSLGTMMVLYDQSQSLKSDGIKAIVVSSGGMKGAGVAGTEITQEQQDYFQSIVDAGTAHFKNAVMKGRGYTAEQAGALFDGRVHDAQQAQKLGLIDEVSTLDAAMAAIQMETSRMKAEDFTKHAAENPEAAEVKALIAQGSKMGESKAHAAEIERAKAIGQACGGNFELAFNSFVAGVDASTAKIAADASAKTKAEAQLQLTEKDTEIKRLNGLIAAGGHSGVGARPIAEGAKDNAVAVCDPAVQAKGEWAKMTEGQKGEWIDEATFVKSRARELARAA